MSEPAENAPVMHAMEGVQAVAAYEPAPIFEPAAYGQYDQHDLDVPAFLRKRSEIM
jgi:hypothetical protein